MKPTVPYSRTFMCCVALVLQTTTQAVFVDAATTSRQRYGQAQCRYHDCQANNDNLNRSDRGSSRLRTTETASCPPSSRVSPRTSAGALTAAVLTVRGGDNGGNTANGDFDAAQGRYHTQTPKDDNNDKRQRQQEQDNNTAVDKIEKIAADLKAKRDDIAADVRARGEAIAADLKAKHVKITDGVLRDRSPEAFGELGGHRSYDSATAGLDVANRRSFFLGIRRVVLLAQVAELIAACVWQALFPYGGVAGFVAGGKESLGTSTGGTTCDAVGSGQGRLGLAISAALGQGALYTILLVFFGCDRVVLRAVRLTGWEHGAAAAWTLVRAVRVASGGGAISRVAVALWLAAMALTCAYFGRQL